MEILRYHETIIDEKIVLEDPILLFLLLYAHKNSTECIRYCIIIDYHDLVNDTKLKVLICSTISIFNESVTYDLETRDTTKQTLFFSRN